MQNFSKVLLGLSIMQMSTHLAFAECAVQSPAHAVPLLELYTSEGCSSCPPADKWLSQLDLKNKPLSALAFHVDYWDYIGWKDRFAQPLFSDRQRKMADLNGLSFVYTPQFLLNGKDFRQWHGNPEQLLSKIAKQPSPMHMTMRLVSDKNDSTALEVRAEDKAKHPEAKLFLAIYENGLVSKVNGGENNGRELAHTRLVRVLMGPYKLDDQQLFTKEFLLETVWKQRDAGAVLFAQDNHGTILQSLTLPFCK